MLFFLLLVGFAVAKQFQDLAQGALLQLRILVAFENWMPQQFLATLLLGEFSA